MGRERGAEVYEVTHGPKKGQWRLRLEKYPEHVEAGSGWFGGRVFWDCDSTDRAKVQAHADAWIRDGVLPGVPDLMANLRASLDRAKAQRGDSDGA